MIVDFVMISQIFVFYFTFPLKSLNKLFVGLSHTYINLKLDQKIVFLTKIFIKLFFDISQRSELNPKGKIKK